MEENLTAAEALVTPAQEAVTAAAGIEGIDAISERLTTAKVTVTNARADFDLEAAKTIKKAAADAVIEGLTQADYTVASWTTVTNAIATDKNAIDAKTTVEEVESYELTAKSSSLVEMQEAAAPTGLTVSTTDDTVLTITATGLLADAEVTQTGLTLEVENGIVVANDQVTITLAEAASASESGAVTIKIAATDTHKAGTFVYNLTRTDANTWTFTVQE